MAIRRLNRKVAFIGFAVIAFVLLGIIGVVLLLGQDPQEFIRDAEVAIEAARATTDEQTREEAYKKAGQTKAKAGSAKEATKSDETSPPPPKKQHEDCVKLEDKLCADLGEACAKWKENGKPGLIDNFVKCKWAVDNGKGYDEMLKEAKAGSK